MSPEEHAGLLRILGARARLLGSQYDMAASAVLAGAAVRRFTDAMRAGDQRDIAEHPDLAHLEVQVDGFYEQ